MCPEEHGDEYYYSLLLLHLPWRDDSRDNLIHPHESAETALLQHRHVGDMGIDDNFTRYDLEDAVRRVMELHRVGLHNADGHHDNGEEAAEYRLDPRYDALNQSQNLQQSLRAYLNMDDSDNASGLAQNVGVVLPHGQPANSFAVMNDGDSMTDTEYVSNLNKMSADERQVLDTLKEHVAAHQPGQPTPEPLRWFITGGAGVGKSFVISLIKEFLLRTDGSLARNPVRLTAPTGQHPHALTHILHWIIC